MNIKIPTKISVVKSDYFMKRARDACFSPPIEADIIKNTIQENYFSPVFLDAYRMSVTALEAFINERIEINRQIVSGRIAMKLAEADEINQLKILEMLKEQDLVTKYRMMPILLWQKAFDENLTPFQDFIALVSIRNDIIHYKMPFYDEQNQKPKWARKLEEKHVLLQQPVVTDSCRVWIDELSTLKGAKWAYNSSCKILKQFAALSSGIIKTTCKDYVNSFEEL